MTVAASISDFVQLCKYVNSSFSNFYHCFFICLHLCCIGKILEVLWKSMLLLSMYVWCICKLRHWAETGGLWLQVPVAICGCSDNMHVCHGHIYGEFAHICYSYHIKYSPTLAVILISTVIIFNVLQNLCRSGNYLHWPVSRPASRVEYVDLSRLGPSKWGQVGL